MRSEIGDIVKWHAELEPQRIQIYLKEGRFTLSGPVQSREEEERAIMKVSGRTPGVQSISDFFSAEPYL